MDSSRMEHDKATILAIIKYMLIAAVVILFLYLCFRLFVILLPFVFGFILARLAVAVTLQTVWQVNWKK